MNDNTKICTCDTMNLEAITHLWNYRPRKFRSDAFLFWSRGPDSYRKNDRKRAVVWPWLVLQLSTVLALTQLGIRQSDWRRAGIRSTNLHIVVEYRNWYQDWGHCGVTNDLGSSPQPEGEARGLWWASQVVGDTTMTEIEVSISILSWCPKAY